MDFEFSDDQERLRDSVRRYLGERAPLSYVRTQHDAPGGPRRYRDHVWAGLADIGLTAMLIPEQYGGAGMGVVDLALGLGEMGRSVYPGPFAASAVGAATALVAAGDGDACARWLPGIATGTAVGAVALTDARATTTNLATDGTVTGTKVHVLDAPAADILLVATESGSGPVIVAVESDSPGLSVTPVETVDFTRTFGHVQLDHVVGTPLSGDVASALLAADDALGVALVLDGVGAAERALELTLEYAKHREQFGKPIGSFQAVQHLCADMLRAVELGRAAAYYAAWACDGADPFERHRAATMARAFAADGFYRVAATAIQVFGGIGFTWEHDIHLFYKRLLTLQLFGGSAADHLEELASMVL